MKSKKNKCESCIIKRQLETQISKREKAEHDLLEANKRIERLENGWKEFWK